MKFHWGDLVVDIQKNPGPTRHSMNIYLKVGDEESISTNLSPDQLRDMVNTLHSQFGGPRREDDEYRGGEDA